MLKVLIKTVNKQHLKGLLGEIFVAVYYFLFHCARVVFFRYKTKNGEIDLILRRGDLIIFCEIKTRFGIKNDMNHIENIVHENQLERIRKCANEFIKRDFRYYKMQKRFDIVVVRSFFKLPLVFKNYEQKVQSKFDLL